MSEFREARVLCSLVIWSAAALLAACDGLDPVKGIGLCEGSGPISANCPECRTPPFAASCPQCMQSSPGDDCAPPTDINKIPPDSTSGAQQMDSGSGGRNIGDAANAGHASGAGNGSPGGNSDSGSGAAANGGGPNGAGPSGAAANGGSAGNGAMSPNSPPAANGGGSAGESGCHGDEDCAAPKPACLPDTRRCVDCTTPAHCKDGYVCDLGTFTCVACLASENCPNGGVCDVTQHQCYACLHDNDCKDSVKGTCSTKRECVDCEGSNLGCSAPKPVCLTQSCVQCVSDDQCADAPNFKCNADNTCVECLRRDGDCRDPNKPVCEVEAQTCVQCLEDGDCGNAGYAHCNTDHTCEPCTTNAQCAHLSDTPYCDTTTQQCVHCLERGEGCDGKACILSSRTCSTTALMSLPICSPCRSDTECSSGTACVPMTFGSAATPVGNFCLLVRSFLAGVQCGYAGLPRSMPSQTSVDGFEFTACGPPTTTTCQGFLDASGARKNCDNDGSVCGLPGIQDGACEESIGRCSYNCGSASDCPRPLTCVAGNICGVMGT